ncbi:MULTISPECIES: glycosyltransferase [unclassified Serinicoccus]|uniref:glycosyltransferase n=1 Tax=unclassified Serinicoccus TaxID=2643101 RepID=UPI0038535168
MTSPLRRLTGRRRPGSTPDTTAGPPTAAAKTAKAAKTSTADTRTLIRRSLRSHAETPGRPTSTATVALAAGPRLRAGLAWEWSQVDLEPDTWRETLARDDLDLCVLELDGSTISGWTDGPSPLEVAAVAAEHTVPVVAWLTGPDPDGAARTTVERLAAAGVEVRFLPPATQPRQQSAAHPPETRRPGDIVLLDGRGSPEAAPVLARTRTEVLHDWRRTGTGGTAAPSPEQPLLAQYRVLADVGLRQPDDSWPVLDALASRTAVVTTPERRAQLPADLQPVVSAPPPEALNRHLTVLLRQPELRDRVTHLAHRTVLSGHSLADRARDLLRAGGLEAPAPSRTVSVVVPTNRPHQLANVLDNVARQQRVDAQLVLVAHGIEVDRADLAARAADLGIAELQVLSAAPELTLGAALNLGIDASDGAYVAKMDDDNFYGAHFLGDLVDAFGHTSAGITGKWAHYVWLRSNGAVVLRFGGFENTYHRLVQGGSIVTHRDVAEDLRFSDIPRAVDSDFLNRAMAAGVSTYSGDRYNFVSIRSHDRTGHTWQVDDAIFMSGSGRVVTYGDPRELVSV